MSTRVRACAAADIVSITVPLSAYPGRHTRRRPPAQVGDPSSATRFVTSAAGLVNGKWVYFKLGARRLQLKSRLKAQVGSSRLCDTTSHDCVFTSRRTSVTAVGLGLIGTILLCTELFLLSPVKATAENQSEIMLAQPNPTTLPDTQTATSIFLPLVAHKSLESCDLECFHT